VTTPLPNVSFPNVFESIWQLVDATVLFAITPTDDGDSPALMDTPDGDVMPAWVIQPRAEGMLPQGFELRQAPLALLLERLPDGTGIAIEPGSPHGVYIPADQRSDLLTLAAPFPPGARVQWGELPAQAQPFADALRERVPALPHVSALWLARFQVEDAREKLACVYAGDEDHDAATVDAFHDVAEAVQPPLAVQIIAITDVPGPTRSWLVDEVTPLFLRSGPAGNPGEKAAEREETPDGGPDR
jgi:hypothetical protein